MALQRVITTVAVAGLVTSGSADVFARGGGSHTSISGGHHSASTTSSHAKSSTSGYVSHTGHALGGAVTTTDHHTTGNHCLEPGVPRDSHGRIARSTKAKDAFKRAHPSPSTGHTSGACPGYVVDHVQALKRGGADAPSNMHPDEGRGQGEGPRVVRPHLGWGR
jgi:hypothetical protein